MNKSDECALCQKPLRHDEIALSRKFIGSGTEEFLCLDCLGKRFKMSREELEAWIAKFKKEGCTLFV